MYYLILVRLSSSGDVFIPGVNPVFNCGSASDATITTTITSVQWLINGTPLGDFSLTNVETEFSQLSSQGTLVFNSISVEYNNTNIQCRATLSNGETVDSNNSTLLVQGERNWASEASTFSIHVSFRIIIFSCVPFFPFTPETPLKIILKIYSLLFAAVCVFYLSTHMCTKNGRRLLRYRNAHTDTRVQL